MKLDFTKYHIVSRIAIYALALMLIAIGIYHLNQPSDLLVYVPDFLPGGIVCAYVVGSCFILVGISFLTNYYVKITSYALAVLLLAFALFVHLPNYFNAGVAEMRTFALINMLKDIAIAAFALHIAAGAHHQHLHFEEND
jgi:hypothetical protein